MHFGATQGLGLPCVRSDNSAAAFSRQTCGQLGRGEVEPGAPDLLREQAAGSRTRGGCTGSTVPAPGAGADPLTAWRRLSLAGRRRGGAQRHRHTSDSKRSRRLSAPDRAGEGTRFIRSGRPARCTEIFRGLHIDPCLDCPR